MELLRLLCVHPKVVLQVITSRGEAGRKMQDMFPNLRGHVDLAFSEPDDKLLATCDGAFSVMPNGVAMQHAGDLVQAGQSSSTWPRIFA